MKESPKEQTGRTSSGQQQGRQNQNRGQQEGSGSPKRMSYVESEGKTTGTSRKERTSKAGRDNSKKRKLLQ